MHLKMQNCKNIVQRIVNNGIEKDFPRNAFQTYIYIYIYIRFFIEIWPEWDSILQPPTFRAHILTTKLSRRTVTHA